MKSTIVDEYAQNNSIHSRFVWKKQSGNTVPRENDRPSHDRPRLPSCVSSSIRWRSKKFMFLRPHAGPNFSRNAHMTAKFGSLSQEASFSDAIASVEFDRRTPHNECQPLESPTPSHCSTCTVRIAKH